MQCFTRTQCSAWLRRRGIIESPYRSAEANAAFYLQFEPPPRPRQLSALTSHLFGTFGEFEGALVVFEDWALYRPEEMALMESVRRAHGELRPLVDAPGHVFDRSEQVHGTAMCYLALIFGWTAYLYLPSGRLTMQFWEGDLVDVWCLDSAMESAIRDVIGKFELSLTSEDSA